MPGKLYQTNEVMVLLGDNWFTKRSVKQALQVAERRKQCNVCVRECMVSLGVGSSIVTCALKHPLFKG